MSITETPRKVPFGRGKTVIIAIILWFRPYNYNWRKLSDRKTLLFVPANTHDTQCLISPMWATLSVSPVAGHWAAALGHKQNVKGQ